MKANPIPSTAQGPLAAQGHRQPPGLGLAIALVALLTLGALPAMAQPSGGPYGPIPQKFELPRVSGQTYFVAPNGLAEHSGLSLEQPTTIEAAFERVQSGDAIVLRGGVYRTGNLILNQGITIQAYADETPVLKGTHVATEWQRLRNGLWVTRWERLFPMAPASWWRRHRAGMETPLHRFNNDMVFIDGRFLQSVGWEGHVDENTFYIDYEGGYVYIGVDPTHRLVEITAYDVAIHRVRGEAHGRASDGRGPTIRGITFTQYAFRAIEIDGTDPEGLSPEANHGKVVVGTTIEHSTFSYCSRVAAYLRGDRMTIRHNKVTDTSTEGLFILSSSDVLLERNIFTRNNIERITGYFPAAVKIFNQCYRVTVNDNLVIDLPYSNGIWYDVGNVDGVFTNNWVQNVGSTARPFDRKQPWPSDSGFFFEISQGVIVAGNVFVNCDQGIFILNASDAKIYNNTLINSTLTIARTPRSAVGDHFGWHPSTGPDVHERYNHIVVNNLLYGDVRYTRPLLFVSQTASLCERLTDSQLKQFDHNVFIQAARPSPLILWSPVANPECQLTYASIEDFRRDHPGFLTTSGHYSSAQMPVFQSVQLGNIQPLPGFPGHRIAAPLPAPVARLLGLPARHRPFIGAFPAR